MDINEYRNKFIKEANQSVNFWLNMFSEPHKKLAEKRDPLLLKFLFCIIQISKVDKLNKLNIPDNLFYKWSRGSYTVNKGVGSSVYFAHSMKIPTKDLKIGETFTIPESTFTTPYIVDDTFRTFDIDDWIIDKENDNVDIDGVNIISKHKGRTILYLKNKIDSIYSKEIRILSGNIKENCAEYMLQQMRNAFDHGKFYVRDADRKSATNSVDPYGFDKDVVLHNENQLNISFSGGNFIGMNYIEYLVDNFYTKINTDFKECFDFINGKSHLPSGKMLDFYIMLLLSKFYVNYIYPLDVEDRTNFNYEMLNIKHNELSNFEYVYTIRTAIAHGWYRYSKDKIIFYNRPKVDENSKYPIVNISIADFEKLISEKEEIFNKKNSPEPILNV